MTGPSRFRVILVASLLATLSFRIYMGVYNNFAVEELGIDPDTFGWLEGIREIPGLLTILLAAATVTFLEERLFAACLALLGGGIWLYARAQGFSDLVIATLVQSVGFHLWYVVQESMVLKDAGEQRALRLGQINSAAAAGTLGGLGLAWALSTWLQLPIRTFFIIAGVTGLAAAAVGLLLTPRRGEARRSRFIFRWQYRSYYLLTLLNGARRHMVLTFAAFALVKIYGTPVDTMLALLAAHSVLSIFTRPLIGRLIDRLGEQRSLVLNYSVLTLVFLGYALIRAPWVAYLLFIVDNVMIGFDIAISTHAARLVPREELASSLATGTSINHIFGVLVPIIGGYLWARFGAQVPFLFGVAIAAAGAAYSLYLHRQEQRLAPAAPATTAG